MTRQSSRLFPQRSYSIFRRTFATCAFYISCGSSESDRKMRHLRQPMPGVPLRSHATGAEHLRDDGCRQELRQLLRVGASWHRECGQRDKSWLTERKTGVPSRYEASSHPPWSTLCRAAGPLRIFLRRHDFTVPHMDDAVAVACRGGVVSDHQHGLTQFTIRMPQHAEHDFGILWSRDFPLAHRPARSPAC